jgi:hypothetical protein
VFIGVLVVAALALFFVRDGSPTYGTEDSPQGILRNYVVALQSQDYERAYSYLADRPAKPTYEYFLSSYMSRQLDITNSALEVGETVAESGDQVFVSVTVVHAPSGVFDGGWSTPDRATLVLQAGGWKIYYLPYPYWGWDWYTPTPSPVRW